MLTGGGVCQNLFPLIDRGAEAAGDAGMRESAAPPSLLPSPARLITEQRLDRLAVLRALLSGGARRRSGSAEKSVGAAWESLTMTGNVFRRLVLQHSDARAARPRREETRGGHSVRAHV